MKSLKFNTIKEWAELKVSLKDVEEWNRIEISPEELKRWIFLKPAVSVKDFIEKLLITK